MGQSAERRKKTYMSERIEALEKLLKKLKAENKELCALSEFYSAKAKENPDEYQSKYNSIKKMFSDSKSEIDRLEKSLKRMRKQISK